jgi:altronate dehydratase large subunit
MSAWPDTFWGYPRPDGQVGIRNYIAIIYTVDCARFVSEQVAGRIRNGISLGWFSCYSMPKNEDADVLTGLGRNPNVAAAVVVGLGCEGGSPSRVADGISRSGKKVEVMNIQSSGGTKRALEKCIHLAKGMQKGLSEERKEHDVSNLTVGLKCGGSDANSGLCANPLVGLVADRIVDKGGKVLSSELTELAGCDHILRRRAATPELGERVVRLVRASVEEFEARYGPEHTMMAPGNVRGGLTTIEEKSLGALMKTGHSPLKGILQPGEYPQKPGWHIVDGLVAKNIRHYGLEADGEPTDFAASGAQTTLFTTGRGSADGNVVSPLIKVCANPETYRNMREDMDYDAGAILEGRTTFGVAEKQLFKKLIEVASGRKSKSELLGHKEGGIIIGGAPLPRPGLEYCP